MHKNHTSAPAPGDTEWNRNAGICLSETSEVCPWAEMASEWNMVSNQQSFIDQSTNQWRDCFIACLKAKSKHSEKLLWCVSVWYVTVMTFKAYTTAVMNKSTYVSFHKVGREQPLGEVVNFVGSFVANLLKYLCAKNYENIMRFGKACPVAWLRWSASLGSRPRLARSLCQVIAAYALRLNSRAGTEGSTVSSLICDRWLMLGLETLSISRCLNHW